MLDCAALTSRLVRNPVCVECGEQSHVVFSSIDVPCAVELLKHTCRVILEHCEQL